MENIRRKFLVFISAIFFINFLYAYTPNSFVVEPLSFSDSSITITNETVSFSGVKINVNYFLKNYSNKTINLSINIDCYPTNGARWLFTPVLIPDDFTIFENDKKISYSVMFEGKEYKDGETLSERGDGNSSILFSLNFKPKEEKLIIINYNNEAEILKYQFNTGNRLVERHFFNPESKKKKVVYLSKTNGNSIWNDFFLLDFLFKNENSYVIKNDYSRIYEEDNFKWVLFIPNNVNQVVCRQDYFCPAQDWSVFHLYYKECEVFNYFDEDSQLSFGSKNLSKELLSKEDLFTLSKKQLSILRNSFYAKHGYNFKNYELKNYFEDNCHAQDIEYNVNPSFSESDFNETEKQNIEIITKMENLKTPILLSDILE